MARYEIPEGNWSDVLPAVLREAMPGDTIVVRNEAQRSLAEAAAQRMSKSGLEIITA